MSAGKFDKAKYETDAGEIVVVKVQPETLAATFTPGGTNAEATGSVTVNGVFPLSLGNRRRKPFSGRYVAVSFTGTVPTGYKAGQILKIPVLTPAVFDTITDDATGTYLGQAIKVNYKVRQRGG